MVCKNCKTKPVMELPNSNIKVCKNCFIRYFERKAYKTITKYKMLGKERKIAVAVSGGKDSLSLLYFMNKLAEKKKLLELQVITIDEGIRGYRNIEEVKKFCNENSISLNVYSFKEEFRMPLDSMIKKISLKPCSICGVLRRFLLNSKARELGMKKIATGHTLDDEAQSILMNQFKGNIERSARLGPVTGVVSDERFVRRVKPFYFLTEKETAAYCFLNKIDVKDKGCPYSAMSYRAQVKSMLNDFTKTQKQTKHAIVNSFLEILPFLKENYAKSKIKECKNCGEPCSSETCQVCEFLKKIKH